jgi:hypothetical protein
MRVLAVTLGMLLAAAAAALALWIFAQGRAGDPGFYGAGVLIADINLALQIVLLLGLTCGAWLARKGRIEAHRVNQTVWVLVNAALVIFIMWGSMVEVVPESAADLAQTKVWLGWLHALIGALTVAGGLWLVLQMNDILPARWHITWWKNLMRATLAGYWAVALLGFATYYLWYAAA